MGRVDFRDQFGQPIVVVRAVTPFVLGADPGAVVRSVGHEGPARYLGAEPVASCVDEPEALPRRRTVNQWLRGLAENLVLAARILVLALAVAKFLAQLDDGGGKITTA